MTQSKHVTLTSCLQFSAKTSNFHQISSFFIHFLTEKHQNIIQNFIHRMAIELNCDPLPCAAIQEDIEDYIGKLDQFYSCSRYQTLHETKAGKYLLTSSNIDSNFAVGVISLFESLADLEANKISLYLNPRFGPCCRRSAFFRKEDMLLAGFDNGTLALIDSDNLSITERRMLFHDNITALTISGDEKTLIGGDLSSRIAVLDLEEFRAVQYYEPAHASAVQDLSVSPTDGRLFVSVGENELVLWDTRSRLPATHLLTTSTMPTSVLFLTDSRIVLGTEGGKVVDFDVKSKAVKRIVPQYDDGIDSLQLLDTESGKKIAVIPRRSKKEGGSLRILNEDLETIKEENYPGKTVNSVFVSDRKKQLFALGEERLFQEVSL